MMGVGHLPFSGDYDRDPDQLAWFADADDFPDNVSDVWAFLLVNKQTRDARLYCHDCLWRFVGDDYETHLITEENADKNCWCDRCERYLGPPTEAPDDYDPSAYDGY